jgi:hypothetical protein
MTFSSDSSKPHRVFTPNRIVALVLITLAVLGLVYLRFAPGDEPVSVPKGAQAGDLILESCEYATEDGAYAADCGTLVVPENRADPDSRLIAVPVTRIKARSEHAAEPIFRLEGGPGLTNMSSPRRAGSPRTTTSSSSATAASTAPSSSTARRSPRR